MTPSLMDFLIRLAIIPSLICAFFSLIPHPFVKEHPEIWILFIFSGYIFVEMLFILQLWIAKITHIENITYLLRHGWQRNPQGFWSLDGKSWIWEKQAVQIQRGKDKDDAIRAGTGDV